MKNLILFFATILLFVSCNDFLDTLPDKRAELNTPQKIAQILVSAYPTELPTLQFEIMSDNTTDNGPMYNITYLEQAITQAYHYQPVTEPAWDSPQRVWEITYGSIASANQALQAIDDLDDPATYGSKAEALLCRAYGHFILASTFCLAYNPVSSETDLGIPYIEEPEVIVRPEYERKTVAYVYEMINKDIEEALPLLDDNFSQPFYHFNSKAAYAFAARFNLFYGKWEKVVEYATKSIGEDPSKLLRDAARYISYAQAVDRSYAYIDTDEPANFLILPQRSLWGRIYRLGASGSRYAHSRNNAENTVWQYFPWGNVANGYSSLFGSTQNIYFPKCHEIFEVTNASSNTGQPHIVLVPFTADETLMCRAEAYAMLGRNDDSARDLSYWYMKNGNRTYTANEISTYYSITRSRSIRYPINSRFGFSNDTQENLVRAALAIRRLDGIHTGIRWLDVKRHGITVKHPVMKSNTEADTLTLKPYDLLTAIQLPADVISAGLPENPR